MTFLRWAGSKKQLGEILENCWHASQCEGAQAKYIEAFAGSASLLFRLQPKRAVIIDINKRLTDCFRIVKAAPLEVASELRLFRTSEAQYYRLRSEQNQALNPIQQAARFIFLNRFCFNGLYRTNLKGEFNVPFGGVRNGTLPDEEQLCRAALVLRRTRILQGDFHTCLVDTVRRGDFVYLDPPYAVKNRSLDLQYGPDVFGVKDLERLGDVLQILEDRGAKFIVSYANCPEISRISKQWYRHKVIVRRSIAANHAHRRQAKELLITNM